MASFVQAVFNEDVYRVNSIRKTDRRADKSKNGRCICHAARQGDLDEGRDKSTWKLCGGRINGPEWSWEVGQYAGITQPSQAEFMRLKTKA